MIVFVRWDSDRRDWLKVIKDVVGRSAYMVRKADGTVLRFNRQTKKLGGKSLKTKNIRSATPRGLFRAIFLANRSRTQEDCSIF